MRDLTPCGSVTQYRNGCRCALCKQAKSEYEAERRAYWGDPANYDPEQEWHGTETGYGKGCRCDECREARRDAEYNRRMMQRYWG